ncbi:hypothetical protein J6590_045392 [Homalodisca vitripennis]|nr:hypothetical protein J6590_045392 [Homalodisca vitripennis]
MLQIGYGFTVQYVSRVSYTSGRCAIDEWALTRMLQIGYGFTVQYVSRVSYTSGWCAIDEWDGLD